MKVYDHEVTESQYAAAVERMQRPGKFKAADVYAALLDAGLPRWINRNGYTYHLANRVADRMIQDHRKRGKIERHDGGWRWI
jgi:hypothetical protein